MSKVYLGRLPHDVSQRDVEKLFKDCGEINNIILLRGYGFVVLFLIYLFILFF